MSDQPDSPAEDRLRPHPSRRFEGPTHVFDLHEVARRLRSEEHPARDGHRQMTIFQRGHITQVVFTFDAGGYLPQHSAGGLVTIHAHEGHLEVSAGGEDFRLSAGQVLVLDPHVPHDVRATEPSVMLLTVHMPDSER